MKDDDRDERGGRRGVYGEELRREENEAASRRKGHAMLKLSGAEGRGEVRRLSGELDVLLQLKSLRIKKYLLARWRCDSMARLY